MYIILGIMITFLLLITSVFLNVFVAYPLFAGLIIFVIIAISRGYKIQEVLKMSYDGGKKAFVVLEIFIIIGAIISIWMASGTVPSIVYYGIKFINPNVFILSAFLICSLVSFLIGTSFGTIGTAGIALMVMGRSGGGSINSNILGGAIIAGAYFGDRCSPMSSSANLVASLTDTDLYKNIKLMLKTSIIPFILASIIYLMFSFLYPLKSKGIGIDVEIAKSFTINWITLLPAFVIVLLAALKVDVKVSMLISIVLAWIICIFIQHVPVAESFRILLSGFYLDKSNKLALIIKGGGILSMLKVAVVVFLSSAFAGIFEGTGMLDNIKRSIENAKSRENIFIITILISLATAAFGCTQALAIILTHQLNKELYEKKAIDKYLQAVDIENSAVVLSPLIPWNIAGLVPATSLMIGPLFIPFAVYLYLIPICNIIYYKYEKKLACKFK
jgi:Na+:H+ antiporter, NhaC family